MSFFDDTPKLTPEVYAREILHGLKVNAFPINVPDLIRERGIVYRESDFSGLTSSFDGLIKRQGSKAMILVNNSASKRRINFTGAHELGHFEIKGHDAPEYCCTSKDIISFKSEKNVETEANRFAAELLMPEERVRQIMRRNPFTRDVIEQISDTFATSLTSAAIRALELTEDPCAIVVSADNRILWTRRSQNFCYELKVKNSVLLPDTYAADFFTGTPVPDRPMDVGPYGWVSNNNLPPTFTLKEHSMYFQNLNLVLSLITLPEKDIDEDEADYE